MPLIEDPRGVRYGLPDSIIRTRKVLLSLMRFIQSEQEVIGVEVELIETTDRIQYRISGRSPRLKEAIQRFYPDEHYRENGFPENDSRSKYVAIPIKIAAQCFLTEDQDKRLLDIEIPPSNIVLGGGNSSPHYQFLLNVPSVDCSEDELIRYFENQVVDLSNTETSQEQHNNWEFDTERFRLFDRENLLTRIYNSLNDGKSVALNGNEGSGRTFLIYYIQANQENRISTQTRVVYLNLQMINDPESFYHALCDKIGINFCQDYDFCSSLSDRYRNRKLVICLDEAEVITGDPYLPVRRVLRAITQDQHNDISIVITSSEPLQEVFAEDNDRNRDSPFHNIFRHLEVRPFTDREMTEEFLLDRFEDRGISFNEEQISYLHEESGGLPGELLRLANDLFDE